jgi:hypothetical protein
MTAVDRANVIEQIGALSEEEFARIREAVIAMITSEPAAPQGAGS